MGAKCACAGDDGRIEIPNMDVKYQSMRLPHAELTAYKTQFEKDFFMVINLMRDNPLSFQTFVKNYVAKSKFDGHPRSAKHLIDRFKSLEKLEPIELEGSASNACFVNLTKNEDNPESLSNGAVKELQTTQQDLVAVNSCFDIYKRKWKGTALELVLDMLLSYYERKKSNDSHTFLEQKLKSIGVSSLENRQGELTVQILFISSKVDN